MHFSFIALAGHVKFGLWINWNKEEIKFATTSSTIIVSFRTKSNMQNANTTAIIELLKQDSINMRLNRNPCMIIWICTLTKEKRNKISPIRSYVLHNDWITMCNHLRREVHFSALQFSLHRVHLCMQVIFDHQRNDYLTSLEFSNR